MPSSRHTLLRSGQFAALCGLSKDTLRFYDRSGVLSPAFIGSNGYRFYPEKRKMLTENRLLTTC